METNWYNDRFLIFYSGKLIMSEELKLIIFFLLAAMMLAYPPVRS